MPDYSIYIAPVKRTLPWLVAIAVIYLFVQPKYLITYSGFRELDYSDVSTYWIIIGGLMIGYILFELIPGYYLSKDYYQSDKDNLKTFNKIYSDDLKDQIQKIECVSSYVGGIGSKNIPGAIHAEYWYYKVYIENKPLLNISCFLAEEINLVNFFKEAPHYVYTLFPTIKNEKTWVVREEKRDNRPNNSLVKRFEKRYKSYTEAKLESIIQSNSHRKEARMAAKNILSSKQAEA